MHEIDEGQWFASIASIWKPQWSGTPPTEHSAVVEATAAMINARVDKIVAENFARRNDRASARRAQ